MHGWWIAGVAGLAAAWFAVVVPRLPRAEVAGELPPDYPALVTPRNTTLVGMIAALSAAALASAAPGRPLSLVWGAWLVLGAGLIWVDWLTTWLPLRMHRFLAASIAVAALVELLPHWRAMAIVAGIGVVTRLIAEGVWRIGAGLGYGDVRLAGWASVVLASHQPRIVMTGWVIITLLGAAHAIAHVAARARREDLPAYFPYGPAIWIGTIVTGALTGWWL